MHRDCESVVDPGKYSHTNTLSLREDAQSVSVCQTYELLVFEKSSQSVRTRPITPARIVSVETGRGFLSMVTMPGTCAPASTKAPFELLPFATYHRSIGMRPA